MAESAFAGKDDMSAKDRVSLPPFPREHAGALLDDLRRHVSGIGDNNLKGWMQEDLIRPLEAVVRQGEGGTRQDQARSSR